MYYSALGNGISVFSPSMEPDVGSFQQIWDYLWDNCVTMAGEDSCRRLLGSTPFVCPPDPRKRSFLLPLILGVAIGKIIL